MSQATQLEHILNGMATWTNSWQKEAEARRMMVPTDQSEATRSAVRVMNWWMVDGRSIRATINTTEGAK